MEHKEALEIIKQITFNFSSKTTTLSEGFINREKLVEALQLALQALEKQIAFTSRHTSGAVNIGKAWNKEEESKLLSFFDSGKAIPEIAREHQRSIGGIKARLIKLGRIDENCDL